MKIMVNLIFFIELFVGLSYASQHHPGLHGARHRAVASLRQKGKQPAKTDIGNLDLFDPMKNEVEATIAAAVADAKAHPGKYKKKHSDKILQESITKSSSKSSRQTKNHESSERDVQEVATPVASPNSHHKKSLAHKVGQVASRAAKLVKFEPPPVAPARLAEATPVPPTRVRNLAQGQETDLHRLKTHNLAHTDAQTKRDDATTRSVYQAHQVKLPIVPEDETAQQQAQVEQELAARWRQQNRDSNPCANGAETVEKIAKELPQIQQQPLWNLVGPDVLHLGDVVDEPLSQIKDSLSPIGEELLDAFPNLRLRDLPVFCSLPKPFPHNFAWAQPLEATASGLVNFFPFHVRNTPLQSLRLEDMVLVGRRQQELVEQDYQLKEQRWEKNVRKSNFRAMISDKQHAIDELSTKTKEIEKDYRELQTLYDKGGADLKQFQSRFEEDQTTLDLQRKLLNSEKAKAAQLEEVEKEIKGDLLDKRKAEEEHKEQQLKNVLQLKEKTGDDLRKQLRELRQTLEKDHEFSDAEMERQQAVIRNVTDQNRNAQNHVDSLQRRVEEMNARIKAEASDKERLEKENKDLSEENQRLSGQDVQLSGLEDQLQSEGAALQKEVKNDRMERERLQQDIDNLENSERAEDIKDAETTDHVKEFTDHVKQVQKSAGDLPTSSKQTNPIQSQPPQQTVSQSQDKNSDDDDNDDDADEADF